jgi:hypothetical protein
MVQRMQLQQYMKLKWKFIRLVTESLSYKKWYDIKFVFEMFLDMAYI